MALNLARYRRIRGLADAPTWPRRMMAGLIAGVLAFLIVQLLLGAWWRAGWNAALFSAAGFALASAIAAATLRPAMAIAYGVIGALWLLAEAIVLMLGLIVSSL